MMKTLRSLFVSMALSVMALPMLAQQTTTVQEVWEEYIFESIPVEYYDAKPTIADFANAFTLAHWGMPLTNILGNYLSVDGYRNPAVDEFICDLKAGYVRLHFKDDRSAIEACYWNLPSGTKRVAVMMYDEDDPVPYPFLRFYDFDAKTKEMVALFPMPVDDQCDPTTLYYSLPRVGKDILITARESGMTGKYVYKGDDGFSFEGPEELLGVTEGNADLLYCIVSSERPIPIYSENDKVVCYVPAGTYNVWLDEPEEGTWRIIGTVLDTADAEYVIKTSFEGGLYMKSEYLGLYTMNYDGPTVNLYAAPDEGSRVVTTIPVDTYVTPIGAAEYFYWIHVRWGKYDGWISMPFLCSNAWTNCC